MESSLLPNDPGWTRMRECMPVARRWAYFDHAAVAPLSGPAQQAIQSWAAEAASEGDVVWPRWDRRIEEVRQLAARLLGAEPAEVALIHNTTEGIHFVAEGMRWQQGDNVVTLASEFPSNLYPWMNLAERGVECRTLEIDRERLDLRALDQAIDGRTRIVSLSWVGYATGWRNDLDAVADLVHQRGAWLFVDAIQGLGAFPLNVKDTPIDFLAADGHKWLLGPEGAGIFFVRQDRLEALRPVGVGWNSVKHAGDFGNRQFELKPTAARYEGGSMNMVGLVGLGASLELLIELSVEKIGRRLIEVTDRLCERLERAGANVASSREVGRASGIVAFDWPGIDPQVVKRRLLRRNVVVNCRDGRLRVSPHAYTNDEDLERLLAGLQAND